MKVFKSYNVQIWVGLREAYTDKIHTIGEVEEIVDKFVNDVKDCVTITPTDFRYVDGHEPGVIIGWINYPRFPRNPSEITERALTLARALLYDLGQLRVSITTPDDTYMLESVELGEDKYEQGETVVASWGLNDRTKRPYEYLYDFGYYTKNGCVVYNHGECNMQDSGAFKLYQIRRATSEDMKNLTWGD
jgi:hypothetical protein